MFSCDLITCVRERIMRCEQSLDWYSI